MSSAPPTNPTPPISVSATARLREFHDADCDAAVRAEIERIIRQGQDTDCYKINALRVANTCGVDRSVGLRAFLFATKLGILDLNYDVYCPSCRGPTEFTKHLMGLSQGSHCDLCAIEFELDYLETIEVTFTVNPNIRPLSVVPFADRDFDGKIEYFQQFLEREGRKPALSDFCQPGQTQVIRGAIEVPGAYSYFVASNHKRGGHLEVCGEPASGPQVLEFRVADNGEVTPRQVECRPGELELRIEFHYPRAWPFLVLSRDFPNNWLSAAYVTSQQDFRDLFSGEFLSPGISFAIRNTTLMFTDIRRSTELFEELGDSAAYALVQDHFDVMADIVRAWEGGIVKTIGDAIMAAFPVNKNALGAACDIQRAFSKEPIKDRFIQVKIGLHRGPTIAVTSNRNLDYFGRTVNIAARVQGKSEANQVLFSDAVAEDPEARALLDERGIESRPFTTALRGLDQTFQLHAIDG